MVRKVLSILEELALEEVVDGVALVTEEGLPAGSKARGVDSERLAGLGYLLLKSAKEVCGSLEGGRPKKAMAKLDGLSVVSAELRNGWCLVLASRSAPLGYLSRVADEAKSKVEGVVVDA